MFTPRNDTAEKMDEQALLSRFSDQCIVPAWLEAKFREWEEQRKYLHTEALAADDDNRVAVNYLFRAIQAKLALLRPERPEPVVKRVQMVEPEADDPRAGMWQQYCKFADRVAKTGACVLRAWSREERLEAVIERGTLDALTTGIVWFKTGFAEDAGRDTLGQSVRHAGARQNLRKLAYLAKQFEAGEFDQEDSRHAELVILSDYAKEMARAARPQLGDPRAALALVPDGVPAPSYLIPEPKVWRGGWVSIVEPENLRFDWQRVRSPEMIHLGRWWDEKIWMSTEEAAIQFDLTDEEVGQIGAPWADRSNPNAKQGQNNVGHLQGEDPSTTDINVDRRDQNREVAVHERYDQELGMVLWWIQGIPRILRRRVLTAQTRRGFPYMCLVPSPAAGRFHGIGDVEIAKKEQDALNQALTDDYEMRIAAYPFYAVLEGFLSAEDMKAIKNREPNAVVELSRHVEDIRQSLQKFPGEPYNPNLTLPAATQSQRNIELLLGMPTEAMQGTNRGTQFATQAAIQSDNLTAQMSRVASKIVECQRTIFEDWLDYMMACSTTEEVKVFAGPFGEWPLFDREHIARGLTVEVLSSTGRANRAGDLEDLKSMGDILNGLLQLRALALQQGLNIPIDELAQRAVGSMDIRMSGPVVQPINPQVIAQAQQQPAMGQPQPGQAAPGQNPAMIAPQQGMPAQVA